MSFTTYEFLVDSFKGKSKNCIKGTVKAKTKTQAYQQIESQWGYAPDELISCKPVYKDTRKSASWADKEMF